MSVSEKPDEALAVKSLPAALFMAISATFETELVGCALVGGTALAGFYAGHRQSDDLDLFTADATAHAMTVSTIRSLRAIGLKFTDERASPTYYHALAELKGHTFTIDIVLDSNIFTVGSFVRTPRGILLASLDTLFMMKVATLVSRCSEKDLYDLLWLTERHQNPAIEDWIALGQKVDACVNAESLLISLTGAKLRIDACGFSVKFGVSAEEILKLISSFKSGLQHKLADHLDTSPDPISISNLVRAIRKLK